MSVGEHFELETQEIPWRRATAKKADAYLGVKTVLKFKLTIVKIRLCVVHIVIWIDYSAYIKIQTHNSES